MSREDHRRHDAELERLRELAKNTSKSKRIPPFGLLGVALALLSIVYPVLVPEPSIVFTSTLLGAAALSLVLAALQWFRSTMTRIISSVVIGIAFLGFMIWRLSFPTTIEWIATSNAGNYLPGTEIGGIKWEPQMADLRLSINNPTDHDYDSLDITVAPDTGIMQAGELSVLGAKLIRNSIVSDVYGAGVDPTTGKEFRQHLDHFIASSYRILCDKIPHKISLQLVFATGNVNSLLGNKKPVTNVHVFGTYHVFGRFVTVDRIIEIEK